MKKVIDVVRNPSRESSFCVIDEFSSSCHISRKTFSLFVKIAKNDPDSYAVFSEQGSSVSQMSHDYIKISRCSGQTAHVVSDSTQTKKKTHQRCVKNFSFRIQRYLDTSTEAQMTKIMVQFGISVDLLERNL